MLKDKREIQDKLNIKLANLLRQLGIKKFYMTVVGNSLATGYSSVHNNKPLLERNETFKSILLDHGINPHIYAFTREENNDEEKVHDWYHNNETEKQRFIFNRHDAVRLEYKGLSASDLDKYYPENPTRNDGMKDVLSISGNDTGNVVIYSGATGSFLDNVTRGGLPKKCLGGFKRDYRYLEATIREIGDNNRRNETKTQIYLCGVPNYLGIGLTDRVINRKLKAIADKYPHVTYVDSTKAKLIYKGGIDAHLSEEEYTDYNNNALTSIIDNYTKVDHKIDIDFDIDEILQTVIQNINKPDFDMDKIILGVISKYLPPLKGTDYDITPYLNHIKNYIYSKLPTEIKQYPDSAQSAILTIQKPDILIYNALTGEVTTNHQENDFHVYGTAQGDFVSIELLLMNTQAENRKQNKNTQIYIYGTGDKKIDKYLKKLCADYINAQFIKPSRVSYLSYQASEEDYLEYCNVVNAAISENYEDIKAQIEIDRKLTQINEELDLLTTDKEKLQSHRTMKCTQLVPYFKMVTDKKAFKKYLLARKPYDFHFIGTKNIKKLVRS